VAQVHGGAIKIDFASNDPSYVTSCTVSGNTAAFGGGLALLHGLAYVDSCTIYENTASHQGGGVWVWDESMWMRNSTLAQNTAPLGASVSYNYLYHDTELLANTILAFGRVGQAVYYDGAGTEPEFGLTCCDIYGNAGGDWVGDIANQYGMNGNISLPPLFCGDANPLEPYTLHSDSPCAPGFNPDCSLIGAWPVGCGAASDLGRESQPAPIGSPDLSFPNPFVAGAAIRFDMHVAGEARLTIHDVSGRVVRNLTALPAAGPGSYRVAWDGKGDNGRCVYAGVYFARLTFVSTALTRQLDLIK